MAANLAGHLHFEGGNFACVGAEGANAAIKVSVIAAALFKCGLINL